MNRLEAWLGPSFDKNGSFVDNTAASPIAHAIVAPTIAVVALINAAAVTCTIMNPEFKPGSGARNGGNPDDNAGFTSCSMRRSEIDASSATAMASMSSASATG